MIRNVQTRASEKPARPGLSLIIAATISLLVHAAVALSMYNRPLGRVDPTLLAPPQLFQVRRADDLIIPDRAGLIDRISHDSVRNRAKMIDLSKALLTQVEAASDTAVGPPRPVLDTYQLISDARQQPLDDPTAVMPSFQVPTVVLEEVTRRPRLKIAISSSERSSVSRTDQAPPIDHSLAQRANVHQLLDYAGLRAASPDLPALSRPELFELRPTSVTRFLDPFSEPPAIDFAQIALAGTTRMSVPEKLDHDFDYELSVYQAPEQRGTSGGYFRVDITGRRSLKKLATMPKDVVFLIDTSSSISQSWVRAAVSGVSGALGSLNSDDRFNIVLFDEKVAFFNPDRIQPFTEKTLAKSQAFLRGARSTGMTDVTRALSRLLVRDVTRHRVYHLVLISDGRPTRGVKDTRELINLITRDNDLAASIYCVGIGSGQNRELLTFLAYRNRGFCLFESKRQLVAHSIRNMLGRLRYPIIKDVSVSIVGLDSEAIYPRDLPNIHQGESFSVYGKFEQPVEFTMRLIGYNGTQVYDVTFNRSLSIAPRGDKTIAHHWARWKLHHLYSALMRHGATEQIREQIDRLRKEYGLKTLY